ncbi:MAG: hybrid sensor histidine kinase/response regulator [Proteobacteria bacterium]|uniref:hybrid sensor histidine kinase/response regulator n=1 Tax=Aquabacterium sp. TaxID=1872578 RepID=UPI0035C6CF60|nr:hybrid sensor histidine kinase/response regulator [Pseudomonadota bacterium]
MRWWPPLSRAFRFDPPRLLAAQMELLDRGMSTAFVASMMVSLLTAATYQLTVGDARIWAWCLATVGLCLAGMAVHRTLPRPGAPGFAPLRYAHVIRGVCALNGGAWGVLGLCFIRSGVPDSTNLVVGMVAGLGSAGLALFGPSWPIGMSYWLTCLVPVLIGLWRADGLVNTALALGGAAYLWAMTVYSFHASRIAARSIELRFENEDLVLRLRDQTLRAQEARQLVEQALVEAEDANRAKTVFLASASHDLRQPLHAAGLYLGALSRAGLNERQLHLMRQVQVSNEAANEMLNTLLDFSKVDAGVVKPQPRSFALQSMCHQLERELAPLAEAKGLAFRLRDTRLVAHADPALVEMVVRNLLVNAVRYTERGAVLLGCRRRGDRVVVEVWDTGIGIPPDQHREIFREFHQLGNSERDRRKGLGLGLAVVEGLARSMGVSVSLASRPGRGSVFRLSLPLSQQTVMDEVRVVPQGDLKGLRVLLIEDDEVVLAAMLDLLVAWGCRCEGAGTLDEALGRLDVFTPHLVVADYRLREHRTGVQAIAAVREALRLDGGAEIGALIVTGDTAPERLREAHASGLQLLHKPVPAEQLRAALLSQWRQIQAQRVGLASAAG